MIEKNAQKLVKKAKKYSLIQMMSMVRHPFSRQLNKVTRISLSHIQTETFHKDFCTSYFPEREAVKKVAKISEWQLDFLKRWQKVDQKDNHFFNRLHQTITGKSFRAHLTHLRKS